MKIGGWAKAGVLGVLMLWIGCARPLADQTNEARQASVSNPGAEAFKLEGCQITALTVYFWRDWMPIVEHPGPDRGSPLYAKAALFLDNSKGGEKKLSFKASVVDAEGQKDALSKYRLTWDCVLKAGETREVEFLSHDGPYLPVGSSIHLEFTFTDEQGHSAIVKTPSGVIERTD